MSTQQRVALVEEAQESFGLNRVLAAVDLPKSTWYYHRRQKVSYEDKYAVAGAYWPPQYVVMDGATLEAGAVAAVRHIANPIDLAFSVMSASDHVMLIGDGALRFASRQQCTVTNSMASKWCAGSCMTSTPASSRAQSSAYLSSTCRVFAAAPGICRTGVT